MTVRTFWNPARLNLAIASAFAPSARTAQADAKARLHEKQKSDVVLRPGGPQTATLVGTGLAAVFERGRRGGYEIVPKDAQVLKIGNLGFAVRATGGPMRSYPALGPAGRTWALGGYQTLARQFCSAAGFRPGLR